MGSRRYAENRWLHVHRFLSLNGWRVSSLCVCCGMCDCLFAVEPCVVVAISLATDYIFRGQLGAKKNEEGKKERKKEKNNSILHALYTQLYAGIVYSISPRLMSLSIYSSCHPWKILDELYRGPSFIRPLHGIYNIATDRIYIWYLLYIIR